MKEKALTVLISLCCAALLLGAAELALRLTGFSFTPPEFKAAAPPCLAAGGCGAGKQTIFERKGEVITLKPEYYGWFPNYSFPAVKPQREYRVFLFGGSSIYNLSGQAEEVYPEGGRMVRLICAGGNSFGTGRLIPVFREVLDYSPDLVLLYTGQNEFVDISVAALLNKEADNRELRGRLLQLKTLELLDMAVYRSGMVMMRSKKRHDTGMVRRFARHLREGVDKAAAYARYGKYLEEMALELKRRGVPARFSTVAYHRTIPPVHPPEAVKLHARGLALMKEGKNPEALELFGRAHDMETVPFGANETSNRIVRETAARYGVPLVEADAELAAAAPGGIPGDETFLDQCHLSDSRPLLKIFKAAIRKAIEERP